MSRARIRTPRGYGRYSHRPSPEGRSAKAAYMRMVRAEHARRRDAARAAGQVYVAEGITHGYSGYSNYCCQCFTCVDAKSSRDSARRAGLVPIKAGAA